MKWGEEENENFEGFRETAQFHGFHLRISYLLLFYHRNKTQSS